MRARIRVLVIDDSPFSRQVIARMLEASPLVEVVGTARDGEEALRKSLALEPDLITLDLDMPRMDGFTFLRILMMRRPTPVIVVSGRAAASDVFRALELGAVDFVSKPMPHATPLLGSIEQELIRKVHAVRELRIENVRERLGGPAAPGAVEPSLSAPPWSLVAIGASTGGPSALLEILGAFAAPPPLAFVVAQHMPAGFTTSFAARLDRLTTLAAREARGGDAPVPGTVLVAPGGCHLEIEVVGQRAACRVIPAEDRDRCAPSVDRLFESAAKAFGEALLAVVLTGMGDDGRRGVLAVKEAGGRVIAESEQTAVIHGMPQQAIRTGAVDEVVPLHGMAAAIQTGVGAPGAVGMQRETR
jgi:two-component system chemotaxis response regulator CheB